MRIARVSAFGRPEDVIELIEQPDPGAPGPGEVLVESEYAPINPADVLNLEGRYGAEPPPLTGAPRGLGPATHPRPAAVFRPWSWKAWIV